MNPEAELNAAALAFEQWRQQRTSIKTKTPYTLREQALALKQHFSVGTITKALGIRAENLRRWALKNKPAQPKLTDDFISLPPTNNIPANGLQLTLSFGNGNQLQLAGLVPDQLILEMTKAVAGGDA